MPDPRIAIIGAGAIGSLLASTTAQQQHTAYWVVRNSVRREQLHCFELFQDQQRIDFDFAIDNLRIISSCSDLPRDLDWIIVAVKAHKVAAVLAEVQHIESAEVLVIANGLHEHDAHIGLLYGGAYIDDCKLHIASGNTLAIGNIAGQDARQFSEIIAALDGSLLAVEHTPHIAVRMWHKLVLNCAVNPLTALLDCINGDLPLEGDSQLIHGVVAEAHAVAHSMLGGSWRYSPVQLLSDLRELVANTSGNSSSMREDLRAGRETEIAYLNLAVSRLGIAKGIACPLNEMIGRMVCLAMNKSSL